MKKNNLIQIGDRFGCWEILSNAGYMNGARKAWLCKCDCERIYKVLQQSLLSGLSTKCRICSNQIKARDCFKDLSGQIFGEWTVTNEYRITKERKTYWVCICNCGKKKSVKTDSLTSGSSTACGDCNSYKDIYSVYWLGMIRGAKRRNIPWEITQEQAWGLFELQNKLCIFTKLPIKLGRNRKNITASLDRIDSDKGYTIDNIQWVHKIINVMKWTLSNNDFIAICKSIVDNNPIDNNEFNLDQITLKFYRTTNRWDKQ